MDFSFLHKTTSILILALISFLFLLFQSSNASIHTYDNNPFRDVGNSALLPGGSEGLAAALDGARSFIRYVKFLKCIIRWIYDVVFLPFFFFFAFSNLYYQILAYLFRSDSLLTDPSSY